MIGYVCCLLYTSDTIKKIVEDIPYLKLEKEQEEYVQQPEETEHIATDEEIDVYKRQPM